MSGSVRSAHVVLTLMLTVCAVACGKYNERATEIAHADVAGAEMVRRDGSVAFALCRDEASYSYFEMLLGIGRSGPVDAPLAFSNWYDSEEAAKTSAGEKVSWAAYCKGLDETGVVYHDAVLVLRDYGTAIEALSDAKDFDGSGLESAGEGAGTAGSALLGVKGLQSTAASVGSAASTAASLVVGFVRERELKKLIERGAPAARSVAAALVAYLDALEGERKVVASHRDAVLMAISVRRDASGGFTSAAESALAFDLAIRGDVRLAAFERRIVADKQVLTRIGEALEALSKTGTQCSAKEAAETLRRTVDEAQRQRPEDP